MITGRVQGVGFRDFMLRTAGELGVTGWVRNRRDGSVEAVVAGTPERVQAMVERAQRGPRSALVAKVDVSEADGIFPHFDMLPTE